MFEVERRRARRFNVSQAVSAVDDAAEVTHHGVTRDVSSSGVCWFSSSEPAVGSAVTFSLKLPVEITLTRPMRARCKGRVVRIEPQPGGRTFIVAVRLDKFEFTQFT